MRSNRSITYPDCFRLGPIDGSRFGARLEFETTDIDAIVDICNRHAESILQGFYAAQGLMVIKGLQEIRKQPQALVELSRIFGPEVENYHETLTSPRFFHDTVPELLILSNRPPCNHPPPPKPTRSASNPGALAIRFPQQVNWHTDQSYRRPPPDITLLFALELPPRDQGQTLFADGSAAFAALDAGKQQQLKTLHGIHAPSWVGRSRAAVENNEPVLDLLPHQLPQRHPLVRCHPVTGALSLFICEEKQMDYVDGPVVGLTPGVEGAGAGLIRELLSHATQQKFVYAHEWEVGDVLVGDNRNLLHCATWYDAEQYTRLMWRTTVMGNPGAEYAGEPKSWLPRDGSDVMAGMEHA
ncbi:MAG: TauD/TfdA family dioxygenase [Gammaproteobacteria bacterium]|nr:TauD/TfdA family dioxygenase [Gammaproteobacteria bacterium]MDH3538147.1 TauD/TfdA family dioxygenase [Gammaproteobacteria bacterium]